MGLLSRIAVLEQLTEYAREQPEFQGIVLASPAGITGADYFARIDAMVRSFAKVIRLPSNSTLVLFGKNRDRELINHRLTKTLRIPSLLSFPPNQADKAFSLIQPYL